MGWGWNFNLMELLKSVCVYHYDQEKKNGRGLSTTKQIILSLIFSPPRATFAPYSVCSFFLDGFALHTRE